MDDEALDLQAEQALSELQSTWDIADISPRDLFAAGYRQGARDAQSGAAERAGPAPEEQA